MLLIESDIRNKGLNAFLIQLYFLAIESQDLLLSRIGCGRWLPLLCRKGGQGMHWNLSKLEQVKKAFFVWQQIKQGMAFGSKTSGASTSMYKRAWVLWGIKLDDPVNALKVKATSCQIGATEQSTGSVIEGLVNIGSFCSTQLPMEAKDLITGIGGEKTR